MIMKLQVTPTQNLQGTLTLPGSKSQCIRAIFFALLSGGRCTLHNMLKAEDIEDALRTASALGATIEFAEDGLHLTGCEQPFTHVASKIHSGNSGITTRFVLPLLGYRAHAECPVILDCGEQMRARPIQPLIEALRPLGMQINYLAQPGFCPIAVQGTLKGGVAEVGGLSSQYLSALLIALPCAENDSVITVKNLHERPYVEMTLHYLKTHRIQYRHERYSAEDIFYLPGKQRYSTFTEVMAGDFSSASCPMVAAALSAGNVTLQGLDLNSPQGDKRLISLLQEMGADLTVAPNALIIRGGKPLQGIRIDANDIPDLLPALAVLGTQAYGVTELYNVRQARIKETNRIHSMTEGLARMGADIEEREDGILVKRSVLHGADVNGYGDHRTVMALAVAGMVAQKGTTLISDAEAVNKTFPEFIGLMQNLGGNLLLNQL